MSHQLKERKESGIWTDHSTAHFTEFFDGVIKQSVFDSPFTYDEKVFSLAKGEHLMKGDQHFSKIKPDIQSAEKMNQNQEYAFVKAHFDKPSTTMHIV